MKGDRRRRILVLEFHVVLEYRLGDGGRESHDAIANYYHHHHPDRRRTPQPLAAIRHPWIKVVPFGIFAIFIDRLS